MVIRTVSEIVFACYTSACRPPTSGGTGGSSSSGGKRMSPGSRGNGRGGTASPKGELKSFPKEGGPSLADMIAGKASNRRRTEHDGQSSGGRVRHDAATSKWSGKAGFEAPAKRAYGNGVEGRIWKSKYGGYEARVDKGFETSTTVGRTALAINRDLKTETSARKWVDQQGTKHAAS